MSLGSLAGHARASPHNPIGMVECDRCREWLLRTEVEWQFYWRGASLQNSGLLVCRRKCLDVPNQQFRTLILPGDPQPFQNPRPSPDITPPYYSGQYPASTPGNFRFVDYQLGSIDDFTYPTTKAATLAAIASATGIPVPLTLVDRSIIFSAASTSQALMGANAEPRTWLAIYSPAQPYAAISTTTAILGATGTSLPIGPAQSWIQADSLGNGASYTGALTAAGLTSGMNLFAWEAPGSASELNLINNGGALMFADDTLYPTSEVGLAAGDIWSNGGEVTVVPGAAGGSLALTFGAVSAYYLVLVGGGELPLIGGTPGSLTLWNNGGVISVS